MFRFSIRDCLLTAPLVAVCFAWACEKGRVDDLQYKAAGLRDQMVKQEQHFSRREAALKAKLMPSRPRQGRCQLGTFTLSDCWDPSSPIPD